jgi:predicted nucleic acid-binding protein
LAIFIDANVPIYAAGRPHPLKQPCIEVGHLVAAHPNEFVTDAEVLQELLHHYLSIRSWPQGRVVLRQFAELMHERVEAVHLRDIERAAALADAYVGLSARDLIHAAVMERLAVRQIVTADTGFDRLAGVERLDPANVSRWRDTIIS